MKHWALRLFLVGLLPVIISFPQAATAQSLTPIHDIQGPGSSSPIVGATVTTRGIVTGVKQNAFFIQEPDASVDADPATSQAILVFTNSAHPLRLCWVIMCK